MYVCIYVYDTGASLAMWDHNLGKYGGSYSSLRKGFAPLAFVLLAFRCEVWRTIAAALASLAPTNIRKTLFCWLREHRQRSQLPQRSLTAVYICIWICIYIYIYLRM